MADAIRVDGLAQFVRNLKKLDSDLPKVLRVAFNSAGESIVTEARAKVPTESGRARASIKMKSTQTAARIVGGSARVPYYAWLDFGGNAPRAGQRPFLKEGRYIYGSFFRQREGMAAKLELALLDAARAAGVEVD